MSKSKKEIIAYEMLFDKTLEYENDIRCVPFREQYWNEYMKIYNECFFKMRKELEVEPINFYYDYSQIKDKVNDIFLYLQNILHVAEWNQNAVKLYLKNGFSIKKKEKVR